MDQKQGPQHLKEEQALRQPNPLKEQPPLALQVLKVQQLRQRRQGKPLLQHQEQW